ncbi:MAG: T9SS type A sorting domain-containing protein [Bacteroidota bacterium]
MKKILLFFFIVLLLNIKSQAQIQFPFTGYELNDYEVGDTLEYYFYQSIQTGYAYWNEVFIVINKNFLSGNDSIKYTFRKVRNFNEDTVQIIITNDSVYNHHNNILGLELIQFDTSGFGQLDSAYIKFDTTNSLKRLRMNIVGGFSGEGYNTSENIGLINWYYNSGNINIYSYEYNLLYAHLAHNGVYGTYLPTSIEEPQTNNLISIYPNPADENFFIQKSQRSNSASVQVYNYTGQLVFENKNFKEENIDTGNLQNGFYVLKYSDGNNYSVKKFLVEH